MTARVRFDIISLLKNNLHEGIFDMKKSIAAISAVLSIVLCAAAREAECKHCRADESPAWGPIGLSVLTPPIQLPGTYHSVYGVMLNVGYGQMHDVYFIDAGIINNVTHDMAGAEVGVVNLANNSFGVQAGIVNVAGMVCGVQVGVVNFTTNLHGLQLGVLNISTHGGALAFPIFNFSF